MKIFNRRRVCSLLVAAMLLPAAVVPQDGFPTKRIESRETWRRDGLEMVRRAKKVKRRRGKAKNVILFVGDGMGISTVTAARILEGQLRGESGEENLLSFEKFSFSAFSKTYSANQQTSDSAPTMVAMVTGIKTNEGIISLDQDARRGDHTTADGNETVTLLELAEMKGLSTGVVSTARITHATPAACYAHTPDRGWESDHAIQRSSKAAYDAGFPDIARQLIEFPYGDGLEVALGGGRAMFMPADVRDPEYEALESAVGVRLDGRDLTKEWVEKNRNSAFVWNTEQFNSIDPKKTDHLLGLFERSHMQYEYDRKRTGEREPSLSEMTSKSIDILSKNKKGYFLMVEAGRIDHAHHDGNAFRSLTDAVEFSNAVAAAVSKVDLDDTLIIVTADHSHTLTIAGYPARGNNILGLVRSVGEDGERSETPSGDASSMPYTTLGYANGSGSRQGERQELTQDQVTNPNYKQEATVPMGSETHAGEDVPIYADGVNAHLISGVMEQNWIFYVMRDALRLDEKKLLRNKGSK